MANAQQIALELIAKDLASATVQRVNGNIANFTQASNKAGVASVEMDHGLSKAGRAVERLAGDILGVNNQVGNLAEGLLEFAGGGLVVTGVAAGITIIGAAFLYFTKEAREAKKAYDDYMDSLSKPTPLAIVGRELDAEIEKLNELRDAQKRLGEAGARPDDIKRQESIIARLQLQYQQLYEAGQSGAAKAGAKVGQRLADEALQAFENTIMRRADYIGALFQDKIQLTKELPKGPIPLRTDESAFGGPVPATLGEAPNFGKAADTALSFKDALGLIAEVTPDVAAGLDAINNSLLGSIPGFGDVAKAATKAVQIVAKVEGAIAIAKGAVKIAESLWPFNPAGIASGTKMIAEGARLSALGGGGGGSHSASGGGGGSGAGFRASSEEVARQRDRLTVILPPIIPTTDPGIVDWLASVIREGSGRDVVLQVGVA